MNEHIQSPVPKPARRSKQLEQIEAALSDAENHLAWIKANAKNNQRELAIRNQERIITQYRRQIADLTQGDWLND